MVVICRVGYTIVNFQCESGEGGVLDMSTKSVNHPHEKMTHYEGDILLKMRNVDFLDLAPSTGSTNRLKRYRRNLSVSRGTEKPLFDDQLIDLLKQYAYNPLTVQQAIEYLNQLRDKDGYLFSRDLKIYSATQSAMERFIEPDHPSFRWNQNYAKSLKWLKETLSRRFKLQPERYDSDDDILQALPKVDTHSGYYYILSGKRKKGDNVEGLQAQLKDRKNRLRKGLSVEQCPILIGFRTQASGEFDDDGNQTGQCKHKTRVVSMYDIRDIVLELQFSNPIQRALNMMSFYAGGKDDHEISRIITGYSLRNQKFMSIDYSSFDQTISSWLIEDAFDVLASMLQFSAGQKKEWDRIVYNFVHKDFILAEGVLHSDKGVPSGSMFTQIIDSIVNILVVTTYFNSINSKCEMIVMGDDNAIFYRGEADIDHLASYINKNFGLIIKVDDKSNEGRIGRDNVKFLSRVWTNAGPWRHPNSLISRMAFPERYRDYSGDVKPQHVLFSYYLTYPAGMRQLINIRKFLDDFPITASNVLANVDSRYIPGSLAYAKEYTNL